MTLESRFVIFQQMQFADVLTEGNFTDAQLQHLCSLCNIIRPENNRDNPKPFCETLVVSEGSLEEKKVPKIATVVEQNSEHCRKSGSGSENVER